MRTSSIYIRHLSNPIITHPQKHNIPPERKGKITRCQKTNYYEVVYVHAAYSYYPCNVLLGIFQKCFRLVSNSVGAAPAVISRQGSHVSRFLKRHK